MKIALTVLLGAIFLSCLFAAEWIVFRKMDDMPHFWYWYGLLCGLIAVGGSSGGTAIILWIKV
ncbi:MAG: hypothetical protein JWQ87_5438 [Candidatus Sulfotelmatobacter sp.]|nr:hypothetical protein [Candidatus Sulfotelmatobacter sp.]